MLLVIPIAFQDATLLPAFAHPDHLLLVGSYLGWTLSTHPFVFKGYRKLYLQEESSMESDRVGFVGGSVRILDKCDPPTVLKLLRYRDKSLMSTLNRLILTTFLGNCSCIALIRYIHVTMTLFSIHSIHGDTGLRSIAA